MQSLTLESIWFCTSMCVSVDGQYAIWQQFAKRQPPPAVLAGPWNTRDVAEDCGERRTGIKGFKGLKRRGHDRAGWSWHISCRIWYTLHWFGLQHCQGVLDCNGLKLLEKTWVSPPKHICNIYIYIYIIIHRLQLRGVVHQSCHPKYNFSILVCI